jgi:hypothetical protein
MVAVDIPHHVTLRGLNRQNFFSTDYPWSNARAHFDGADPAHVLDLGDWKTIVGSEDWREWLRCADAAADFAERLRNATRAGRPLGDDAFVAVIGATPR